MRCKNDLLGQLFTCFIADSQGIIQSFLLFRGTLWFHFCVALEYGSLGARVYSILTILVEFTFFHLVVFWISQAR